MVTPGDAGAASASSSAKGIDSWTVGTKCSFGSFGWKNATNIPKLILPAPAQLTQASFFWSLRAQKLGEFLYFEGSVEIFKGLRSYAAISCQV